MIIAQHTQVPTSMNKLDYVQPGNRVSWKSAAGDLTGTIKRFYLARNANDELIPWMVINVDKTQKTGGTATLCAIESYLQSMHLELLEADVRD
jgi:hypothetical protein